MTPRHTWFWLLLAGGLLAFILFHEKPARQARSESARILPNFKAAAVSTIEVLPKGQTPGICATRANGAWRLTQPFDYPAQPTNIENLLLKLQDLESAAPMIDERELATNRLGTNDLYGIDPPQATVILNQSGPRVRLGRKTPPGDQMYVQVDGKAGIYVVDAGLLNLVPTSANDWRDPALLDLKVAALDHVSVTNGAKVMELQRNSSNGLWRVTSPAVFPTTYRADSARIDAILRQLQEMRISEFLSDNPKTDLEPLGLQPAELQLGLAQGTNTLVVFQFGKTNGADGIFARRLGQSALFTVPKEPIDAWRVPLNNLRAQSLVTLPRLPVTVEVRGQDQFSVELQTNGSWRVMPLNFPADDALILDLLTNLSGMPIVEFTKDVATELTLPDYGLGSPYLQYLLPWPPGNNTTVSSNTHAVQLQFGSTNSDRVYARRTDEVAPISIYAVALSDFQRLPSASWQLRERRIWNFQPDEVAQVTLRNKGQTLQLLHQRAYEWSIASPSQGAIDNTQMLAIEETIRGLSRLFAISWVGHGFKDLARLGFGDAGQEVTLQLKNGDKRSISFGGKGPSGIPYASVTLEGEPWFFEFPPMLYRDVAEYLSP